LTRLKPSLSDKNSLSGVVSIGKLGLWVKGKTSEHIVVMDKRVQRILAIEARAGQMDGSSMKQKFIFLRASPFKYPSIH
jgi:hypothetical protein